MFGLEGLAFQARDKPPGAVAARKVEVVFFFCFDFWPVRVRCLWIGEIFRA